MAAWLAFQGRDQFRARHKADLVQVAYAPSPEQADAGRPAKASAFAALDVRVHLCGDVAM